jgi:cytochrome P450
MTDALLVTTDDVKAHHDALRRCAHRADTAVNDFGMVHVFRYPEIDRLLHDTRLEGIGLAVFDMLGVPEGPLRSWYGGLMFTNEGAAHHRLRRLVGKAFTPSSVDRLRERAAALAAERMATVEGPQADLAATFGRLPMQVMCALLGVPDSSVADFGEWTDALSAVFGMMTPEQLSAANAAIEPMLACVAEIVEHRSHTPADDLISALVAAEHEGDTLTRDETVAMAVNLLAGGHDTTASQIGCTLFTLLQHPDAWRLAVAEPDSVGSIVSESIRFEPSLVGAPRTVVEPVAIGDVERPAGTMVLLTTMTGNRDPEVWHEPDTFQPERFRGKGAPKLLSFGAGPHYCLGAALARMTLEETVRAVAPRAPELAVEPDDVQWAAVLGRAPLSLPVSLRSPRGG